MDTGEVEASHRASRRPYIHCLARASLRCTAQSGIIEGEEAGLEGGPDGERHERIGAAMMRVQRSQRRVGQHIGIVEEERGVPTKVPGGMPESATGIVRTIGLVRDTDIHTEVVPRGQETLDLFGVVVRIDHEPVRAGIDQPHRDALDQWNAPDFDERLRDPVGQRAKPGAQPGREDHGIHGAHPLHEPRHTRRNRTVIARVGHAAARTPNSRLRAIMTLRPAIVACALFLTGVTDAVAQSLDLGIDNVGLSIGNSPRWTGVRLNWRDSGVEYVHGINLTIWKPEEGANPDFVMSGLALGVFGPWASELNGISIGLGGVVADDHIRGFGLGGLAVVSGGPVNGISLAGLAAVAEGDMRGAQIAGLAAVAQGEMAGINAGGLAVVSEGGMRGFNFGGLAAVSQGEMSGVTIGGLAAVSEGGMRGLNFGGLATVSQGPLTGINFGGLAIVSEGGMFGLNVGGLAAVSQGDLGVVNLAGLAMVGGSDVYGVSVAGAAVVAGGAIRGITAGGGAIVTEGGPIEGAALSIGRVDSSDWIRGLAVGGYRVKTPAIEGLSLSVIMNRTTDLSGGAIGIYNEVRGVQRGVTIGIFNTAETLRGIQIGLLNHAANNSPPFRWLPLINASF